MFAAFKVHTAQCSIPGQDHIPYWGTILPVDHPFWSHHRPGDRWNCKCSLEATDEPATSVPSASRGSYPHQGLDSNPGTTAQLFSQSHPYFPDSCAACPFGSGLKNRLSHIFTNRKPDCVRCKSIDKHLPDPETERIKAAKAKYRELSNDSRYTAVRFDKRTGGLVATHIGHITHDSPKAERFFDGLTSSDLERECQREAYRLGHTAILLDESKKHNGNYLAALDLELDGVRMDIRSVTGKGWYSNIFVHKNDQLRRYNARKDVEEPASALCLYFHDPALFSMTNMERSINYFRFYRDHHGNLLNRHLTKVYCIINGGDSIKTFDI